MLLKLYHGNLSLLCHRNFDKALPFQFSAPATGSIQKYVQNTLVLTLINTEIIF